jgi:hypothetical protein
MAADTPLRIQVISPCSTDLRGPSTALALAQPDRERGQSPSLQELLEATLEVFDAWGRPRDQVDAAPAVLAFAELGVALSLAHQSAPGSAVVVHLLCDPNVNDQSRTRWLMEEWLTLTANQRHAMVTLALVDVSVERDSASRASALDPDLPTQVDEAILDQAMQQIIVRTAPILATSVVRSPVYLDVHAASTLAKQALSEAMRVASAAQAARLHQSRALSSRPAEAHRSDGEPAPVRLVVHGSGHPIEPFTVPSVIATGTLHHQFDHAVRLVNDALLSESERRSGVVRHRLGGYVEKRADSWALTASAWSLIESFPYAEGEGYSACAELLVQQSDQRARSLGWTLQRHLHRWHVTGIFRQSYVPEFVLHDAPHAQAVDRHAAALMAPALESGELTAYQVYLVALAAWLHDWGHASGGAVGAAPTTGKEVRDLHGLLSGRRIHDPDGVLDEQLGLLPAEKAWAALLAQHHQSWTSCDDRGGTFINEKKRKLAERFGLSPRSFSDDFAAASALASQHPAEWPAIDYPTAQSLLAVLRVADGADMGMHRTPHMTVPTVLASDEWTALRGRASEALALVERVTGQAKLVHRFDEMFSDAQISQLIRRSFASEESVTEEEVAALVQGLVDAAIRDPGPEADADVNAQAEFEVIARDLRASLVHLITKQAVYFPRHASIASVHLVPCRRLQTGQRDETVFRALVRANPGRHDDERLRHVDTDSILAAVRHDLLKEVGAQGDEREWRRPLAAALERIGVMIDETADAVSLLEAPVQHERGSA